MTSVAGNARREQAATTLALSAKTRERSHPEKQKSFCTEHDDFQSPWKRDNPCNRAQDAAEEEPPKEIQLAEVQTTVMRACWGK
jgi:hypothetical protein